VESGRPEGGSVTIAFPQLDVHFDREIVAKLERAS
jgi:hypothetical protein